MDHAEARALLELATAEPGGFERLMAGDTPESSALAGHLAGCPECTDEMTRLRRAGAVIREVVRSTPPADLRERTLALVASVGRDRSEAPAGADAGAQRPVALETPAAEPRAVEARRAGGRRAEGRRPAAWLAGLAAVLILAVAAAAIAVGGQRDAQRAAQLAARDGELAARNTAVRALERVTTWTLRITAQPDAARVQLTSADGSGVTGSLVFSPDTRELVVVAFGLVAPEPGAGREYRCWVEVDGSRRPVGRMFFADGLAFWVGEVEDVGDLPSGATFGVTLVDAAGESLDGPATLGGAL